MASMAISRRAPNLWPVFMHCRSHIRICQARASAIGLAMITFLGRVGSAQPMDSESGNKFDLAPVDVEEADAGDVVAPQVAVELPSFMRSKTGSSELVLRDKREGVYYTGIPLIGYDPEQGFNYGLAIQRYNNGEKESPFFSHAPYRKKLSIAAAASTGGSARAVVAYDQPYINDTPWRLNAYAGWVKSERENYFGNDERSLEALSFPGAPGQTFRRIDDYKRALERVVNGTTYSKYNLYFRQDLVAAFNLEYDLLGGRLRPLVGFQLDYADIDDYTGLAFNGGTNAPTLLRSDQDAGLLSGFNGGWNNLLRMGVTFDTRDYEPNPTRGYVIQLLAQGGLEDFGSDFTYAQVTLNVQGYYPLFPSATRLVLAGQMGYSLKEGDVPFFAQPNIALPNAEDRRGLGGFDTMRGNVTSRFTSDVYMHANAELRWTFGEFNIFKQKIDTMLVPFVDTGRVFDTPGDTMFTDWKVAGGIGLRLAWNVATIISFDYGMSSEGSLFWMELGHQF